VSAEHHVEVMLHRHGHMMYTEQWPVRLTAFARNLADGVR
jgi:hypothetical protein